MLRTAPPCMELVEATAAEGACGGALSLCVSGLGLVGFLSELSEH